MKPPTFIVIGGANDRGKRRCYVDVWKVLIAIFENFRATCKNWREFVVALILGGMSAQRVLSLRFSPGFWHSRHIISPFLEEIDFFIFSPLLIAGFSDSHEANS